MADTPRFKYPRVFPFCPQTSLTDYSAHRLGQPGNVNPIVADFVACSLGDLMDVFWNIERFTITTSGQSVGGRAFNGTFNSLTARAYIGGPVFFGADGYYAGTPNYTTSYAVEVPRGEPYKRVCAQALMGLRINSAVNYPSLAFMTLSTALIGSQWYLGYSFCFFNDVRYTVSNPSAANNVFTSSPAASVVTSGTFSIGNIALSWQGRNSVGGTNPTISGATTTRYNYV